MTRPTLASSLAALADELHVLDRESRWAKMKAASARSAADYEGQKQDADAQETAAHHPCHEPYDVAASGGAAEG